MLKNKLFCEAPDAHESGTPALSQLRVAVISDAWSQRNGVGAYYHDLCELLAAELAQIVLICPGRESTRSRLSFPLPGDRTQRVCLPQRRELRRQIASLDPHVIVVPTPGPYGLYGARLARQRGCGLVVGFHTHFEKIMHLYWRRWFGSLTVSYFEMLNLYLFRRAGVILANSQDMVSIAQRRSRTPVALMGTPLPRSFLSVPLAAPVQRIGCVLYAGRLAAEKNLPAIIDAARRLPDLQFSVAGEGPYRAEVEAAARALPNLQYLGWLGREAMREAIDAADLLILPSHVESFGTIALEAMARARPVLVSAHCGINEWPELAPGLFRMGQAESAAQAIQRVAALDGQLLAAKARKARAGAEAVNRWNLSHWQRILQEQARSAPGAGS
ncbi:glycosyltransferase [Granulosicoccaceae sp. 1_MG-2023]|nr:glycosyltransferase [Granulosicoccaceae sp. 1_MG-2023]